MTASAPRISILLAVHNGMPFFGRTLESILAQTFDDFELLVVDDGSTDDTPRCARSSGDSRVHYHRLDKVGFPAALNHGLRLARAPLVARIDADDLACPDRLAEQHAYMTANPDGVLLGCQAEEIDAQGAVVGRRSYPLSDAAIRWRMLFGCPFLHPGVMFRREEVLACGGYDDRFPCAQDYDLWTRLAGRGKVANHPQRLMQYRVHPGAVTTTRQEAQVEFCAGIAARYAKGFSPGVDESAVADLYYFFASGRKPRHVGHDELARAYRRIKDDFLGRVGEGCDELSEQIDDVQRCLRWYCLERAEASWLHPGWAWYWLRLAGRFDPENGTIGRILVRRLRRAFCRPSLSSGEGTG